MVEKKLICTHAGLVTPTMTLARFECLPESVVLQYLMIAVMSSSWVSSLRKDQSNKQI